MYTDDETPLQVRRDLAESGHSQWPPFETESAPPTAMAVEKDQQLPAYHAYTLNKLRKEVGKVKGGTY